jgi:hypothetical protein
MLCRLAAFCAVKRSTSEKDLCSQPFCTFVIAYPKRAFRLAASSPALLLLEEAAEAARDLLPTNPPFDGVKLPPGTSFACPSDVLFVPIVATGVEELAGLIRVSTLSFPAWSSGVLSRTSASLLVADIECSVLFVAAVEDGEVESVSV